MCWRYSSKVVAPMHWSSPLAKAGLSRLAASMPPSTEPAPTRVWISSMIKMTLPAWRTSAITCLRRSSNSPRKRVPATNEPISRAITRISANCSGRSPLLMRRANPSARAVLPTPGSPISTGLFLVRRPKICMTRSISWWRPTTGSIFPSAASWVKSVPNSASALPRWRFRFLSPTPPAGTGTASVNIWISRCRTLTKSVPKFLSTLAATPAVSWIKLSSKCSGPI